MFSNYVHIVLHLCRAVDTSGRSNFKCRDLSVGTGGLHNGPKE